MRDRRCALVVPLVAHAMRSYSGGCRLGQYTRALGGTGSTSLVSVFMCTGR